VAHFISSRDIKVASLAPWLGGPFRSRCDYGLIVYFSWLDEG